MVDENVSLEIAANLLHLYKTDENGEKQLDDGRVATALAESMGALYGDYNQDDIDMSGDPETMRRGVEVLENALRQYEMLLELTETQVARKHLGAS